YHIYIFKHYLPPLFLMLYIDLTILFPQICTKPHATFKCFNPISSAPVPPNPALKRVGEDSV
ncbi:hypothetical protein N3930_47890, partial [Bacillus thuringiensis]|nr:hypothetical protein [Bacillus thuringiensis]